MTVLHINSSARLNHSNTRIIGQYLVDALGEPVDALLSAFHSSDIAGAA